MYLHTHLHTCTHAWNAHMHTYNMHTIHTNGYRSVENNKKSLVFGILLTHLLVNFSSEGDLHGKKVDMKHCPHSQDNTLMILCSGKHF